MDMKAIPKIVDNFFNDSTPGPPVRRNLRHHLVSSNKQKMDHYKRSLDICLFRTGFDEAMVVCVCACVYGLCALD